VDGALLKLTIIPFAESEGGLGPPAGPPFVVQFNPETYTDTTEFKYGPDDPPQGSSGSEAKFEVFGPSGMGWECYSVGAFGGDDHVRSLGLIPGPPRLPFVPSIDS